MCERYEAIVDYKTVKGSGLLDAGGGQLGSLTQWRLVLPLEFKMHLLTMTKLESTGANGRSHLDFSALYAWQTQVPEVEHQKINKCPACLCELFPEPFMAVDLA